MKKFAKLSLVAAVAVAGLSANAASLEESIKNIDVSGSARIRYNTTEQGGAADYIKTGYAVDIATKVSDDTTVTASFYGKGTDTAGSDGALNDQAMKFGALNVTYTGIKNTTLIIGKQALGTPFTVAADLTGDDMTGTGIIAVNTSTPVTLVGAYMQNINEVVDTTVGLEIYANELVLIAGLGNVAGIDLEAWYAKTDLSGPGSLALGGVQDITTGFYKASYKTTVEDIKLGLTAQYATGKLGAVNTATEAITQLKGTAAMGMFSGEIRYLANNKAAGYTVAFDGTAEAYGFEGTVVNGNSAGNGESAIRYAVAAQVLPSLKVGVNYDIVDITNVRNDKETRFSAAYTMAKGVTFSTWLGTAEVNNTDYDFTRIQLDYKF